MTATEAQLLPSIAGAQELMHELSPHGLSLNLDCLQRAARILAQTLLPQARP